MEVNKFDLINYVHLFVRKLCLKTLHHKQDARNMGMEVLNSLSKSECRALKGLLESEDDLLETPGPSTPMEPDFIDLLNLEA